jgi:hypothetical protein
MSTGTTASSGSNGMGSGLFLVARAIRVDKG